MGIIIKPQFTKYYNCFALYQIARMILGSMLSLCRHRRKYDPLATISKCDSSVVRIRVTTIHGLMWCKQISIVSNAVDGDQQKHHYNDVIMVAISSQITSLAIVYSTVYSDADQRKHQSSALLTFVRGIHRGLMNSPHKWPVTRKKCFHSMTSSWLL